MKNGLSNDIVNVAGKAWSHCNCHKVHLKNVQECLRHEKNWEEVKTIHASVERQTRKKLKQFHTSIERQTVRKLKRSKPQPGDRLCGS